MEALLHYVWRHKIYPLAPLRTTAGEVVEVIDPGLPNSNAGPDFFNAKLRVGDTHWAGNVEVHVRASDWLRHGHDRDKAYDNVVLHVVGEADCEVYHTTGERVPQLVLAIPEHVTRHYAELHRAEVAPPCYTVLGELPRLTVHGWLSALQAERLEQKARLIGERLERCTQNWEDVFFITLARNFGFGLNGDAFEAWATSLPFRAIDKHRDNLQQVEAIFFGQAGLLEEEARPDDAYYQALQREYRYLRRKFDLPLPMPAERWRFLRLRPGNFPHVRIAQLASLYHREQTLFSRVMEAETPEQARTLLASTASPYWEEHFTFRSASPRRKKAVGASSLNLILINTVIPFLYAYGRYKGKEALCERAARFLEELPAEQNHIIRMWDGAGLPAATAADSQAIIQLQRNYCERKECLRCRFGYEYLKRT